MTYTLVHAYAAKAGRPVKGSDIHTMVAMPFMQKQKKICVFVRTIYTLRYTLVRADRHTHTQRRRRFRFALILFNVIKGCTNMLTLGRFDHRHTFTFHTCIRCRPAGQKEDVRSERTLLF